MSKIKNHLVYQFKISLYEIEPCIWRRIQVPAKYSFWDLHVAIQDAVGWLDYQAMGLRIVNAGKSKYYDAAISNFEQAKRYYEKAGLEPVWLETVEKVMNNHARKHSFMPGFKRVVAGKGPSTEPSFIERAKTRWRK